MATIDASPFRCLIIFVRSLKNIPALRVAVFLLYFFRCYANLTMNYSYLSKFPVDGVLVIFNEIYILWRHFGYSSCHQGNQLLILIVLESWIFISRIDPSILYCLSFQVYPGQCFPSVCFNRDWERYYKGVHQIHRWYLMQKGHTTPGFSKCGLWTHDSYDSLNYYYKCRY